MKRLVYIGVVLAAGAVAARAIAPRDGTPRLVKVVAHPYERTVTAPGTLKASRSFRCYAALDAVLNTLLPEGSRVKAGDVVARLDVSDAADKLRDRTINRDMARCDLDIQGGTYDLEGYETRNRVAFAEADLAVAELARDYTAHALDAAEFVRDTKSLEAKASLKASLAKSLAEMKPHLPRGFVSKDDVDKTQTRLATEELETRALSLERSLVTSGALPDARAKAERDVQGARGNLELARVKRSTFEQRKTDGLADLSTKVEALEEEIAAYSEQVGRGTLKSPVDGVIIHAFIPTQGNQEKPHEGTRLPRGALFAEVVQPGNVWVSLNVAEADAALIAVGQPVHFAVDAYPGRAFEAKVNRVKATVSGGRWARWIYPDIRKLDVGAEVVAGDPGLLPEMTVTGKVVVETRAKALWVDVAAVSGGFAFRADGTRVAVQVGRVSGQEIEVTGGLAEGDELAIATEPGGATSPAASERVAVVEKDLPLTIADAGTLEPVDMHDIAIPELDGETSLQMIAAEGAAVKKGEVIARLDDEALQAKLKEKQLDLTVAEKDREVAVEQAKSDLEGMVEAARVAELDMRVARLDEMLVNLGQKPRIIRDLATDLEMQKVDIALVSRKLELKDKLSGRGYVSAEEVKNLRQDLLDKQVNLEVAAAKFELAKAGALPADRQKAAGNRKKAELNLELARRRVASREARRDLEVKKAELGIKKARFAVERLERMIASLTVKSPAEGTAMRPERWGSDGWRKYREGDAVREGTVFARVADLDRFQVKGVVAEERVQSVKPGLPVRYWLANFPGEVHDGVIASVGYVARERNERNWLDSEEPRVFDILVSTRERDARFQPGLSVQFEIAVGRVERALVVPLRGLHYDADGPYVFVGDGSKRRVKLGDEEKGEVQVLAGVGKGEDVLVPRDDR